MIIVKVNFDSPTDPAAAAETLQMEQGIGHLDVVVANDSISENLSPVHGVPINVPCQHVEKSMKPMFVGIGSPLGRIGGVEQRPYPCAAYGPNKAVLHWIAVGFETAFQAVEESVEVSRRRLMKERGTRLAHSCA
ncbi:uncharacterized protein N7503_007628 [Penicillium pulvis]|uniref:uncharacterized protein n=1 Tax=Penicillium pulvis TaxID=1562058 RepID=UPI002548D0F3|nr:uncharacterized protein N7503_007628 [Penicillium pulvis]KAJ5798332.1 hypothetical protein N7503_007628 [Penicillium pulvis]